MIINHNISALNTYRQLSANNSSTAKSLEKLSSGLRINRAGDDAAGLAISEKMRAQIRGLEMATKNAQDGISLIQTAEGALNEVHAILQRMRELAVQAANDTNNDNDRAELQKEIEQLIEEINRISADTEFNTKTLLDGSLHTKLEGNLTNATYLNIKVSNPNGLNYGDTVQVTQTVDYEDESSGGKNDGAFEQITFNVDGQDVIFTRADLEAGITKKEVLVGQAKFEVSVNDVSGLLNSTGNGAGTKSAVDSLTVNDSFVVFHIGANANQSIKLAINNMSASALGVDNVNIDTQSGADSAITTIQNAIDTVSSERSKLGAYQNRLEHTINNLGTSAENLTAAESRIRDVDMAKEMMEFTKNSILTQAATAMLAQANQLPQSVLQLLR